MGNRRITINDGKISCCWKKEEDEREIASVLHRLKYILKLLRGSVHAN
jgi:hypothetical protein